MLLDRAQSCLLIVDVQERLVPVMTDPRRVIHHCTMLLRAAERLSVPSVASEQYPKGLGPTIIDLRQELDPKNIHAKTHFSAAEDRPLRDHVMALGRPQIVIAGIESHVCVLQSALGFKALGLSPVVVADACASRRSESEQMAWGRLRQESVPLLSLEMVIFEWLNQAGSPEFKDLSGLIR